MPHDKNGALLNVGDRVTVEFEVKEIHMADDYCNTTLVIPGEHGPHNVVSTLVVNAKQTLKSADGPTSFVNKQTEKAGESTTTDQADGHGTTEPEQAEAKEGAAV